MPNYSPLSETPMDALKNYLEAITHLPQSCWRDLSSLAVLKSFEKNDYLIRKGSKYNNEVFIVEGIVRGFFVDENGNDKNVSFYLSESFMSINNLRSNGGYSLYSFQTLTDAVVLEFDSNRFAKIINDYPELLKAAQLVKEQEVDRLNKRDLCIMEVTAEEKYSKFLECYPEIENLIPHYNIASYLGISPVTLSRVRQK